MLVPHKQYNSILCSHRVHLEQSQLLLASNSMAIRICSHPLLQLLAVYFIQIFLSFIKLFIHLPFKTTTALKTALGISLSVCTVSNVLTDSISPVDVSPILPAKYFTLFKAAFSSAADMNTFLASSN